MKWLREKLVEEEKDGYEVYEVTYLERRMTEKHWKSLQTFLDNIHKKANAKSAQ